MDLLSGDELVAMMCSRDYDSIIKLRWDNKEKHLARGNPVEFRHLSGALLRAGRIDEAIGHYQQLIDVTWPHMRGDTEYNELAASYWLQAHRTKGSYEETVTNLRLALKCNYGDGAKNMTPALLLYYVAVRTQDNVLKQESIDQIEAKLKTGWAKNWPAPLGRLLTGTAGEDHVEQELANEHPLRQPDERCRFHFYRGVKFLESGDEIAAEVCFRRAVDEPDQKTWTTEFVLARDELGETPVTM